MRAPGDLSESLTQNWRGSFLVLVSVEGDTPLRAGRKGLVTVYRPAAAG